jgi:hypothetical protein
MGWVLEAVRVICNNIIVVENEICHTYHDYLMNA